VGLISVIERPPSDPRPRPSRGRKGSLNEAVTGRDERARDLVLVGPMPTRIGTPTCRCVVRRIRSARRYQPLVLSRSRRGRAAKSRRRPYTESLDQAPHLVASARGSVLASQFSRCLARRRSVGTPFPRKPTQRRSTASYVRRVWGRGCERSSKNAALIFRGTFLR